MTVGGVHHSGALRVSQLLPEGRRCGQGLTTMEASTLDCGVLLGWPLVGYPSQFRVRLSCFTRGSKHGGGCEAMDARRVRDRLATAAGEYA